MSSKNKNRPDKNKPLKASAAKANNDRKNLWVGLGIIAVLTFLVYLPVFSNGFVNLDDDYYIENQHLIRAFDLKGLFSQFIMGNYHPLVMMAYTIIYHFAQLNPKGYHAVSLILHIINTGLVLWLIYYLTRSLPVSFIVALLFGIHPLHVESVAWASELKDLMYTLGFLASLIFYVRYVKENQPWRFYIYSLLFFLFSLLSKGMGASLTVVLFLVDFYLGRKFTLKTVVEKIPFFILSIIFGVVAIIAQKSLRALSDIAYFTFPQHIIYACYAFIIYIVRIFVPLHLSAYYPYPVPSHADTPSAYYIYPLLVIVLVIATFYSLRKTKKIFFGIGFFALTVFLVLQLIPVGGAIAADRYTYIPSIGIFFLMAEGIVYLSNRSKQATVSYSPVAIAIVIGFVLFFSFETYNRVKVWKDGMALWNNVIENYQTVSIAYNNRAKFYEADGELQKAVDDCSKSLQLNPADANTWGNLGLLYWELGTKDTTKAADYFTRSQGYFNKAVELKPDFATAYSNRGLLDLSMNKFEDAVKDLSKSIELDPYFSQSYYNRGVANFRLGKKDEACADIRQAVNLGYPHAEDVYTQYCN